MMSWSVVGVMELPWNTRCHISMDIFLDPMDMVSSPEFLGGPKTEETSDGIPGFPQKNESRPSSPHLRVDAVFVPSILELQRSTLITPYIL